MSAAAAPEPDDPGGHRGREEVRGRPPLTTAGFVLVQLAGFVLFAASVAVYGHALLRRLWAADEEPFDPFERWSLATALGLGLVGEAGFVLGLVGGLHRVPILALLALGHLLSAGTWRELARARREIAARVRQERRILGVGMVSAVAVSAAPIVAMALYPPTHVDAVVYHLPYVRAFLETGRLGFFGDLIYPIFPQVVEMGFTAAFAISGEAGAQLTQVLALFATAAAVLAWGRRTWPGPVGLWAAALWLGVPLAVWIGVAAYVDVGLTLFVTAAFLAWQRWDASGRLSWAAFAGAFAGLAAGSKYLGLFFCAALVVLTIGRSWRRRGARPVLVLGLLATLAAGPWYLRIAAATGNPLFPYYPALFGRNAWSELPPEERAVFGSSLASSDGGGSPEAIGRIADGLGFLVMTPWNAVFAREVFHRQAPLTPLYLVLGPFALAAVWRDARSRRPLAVAAVYALFWLTTIRDVRFLLPVLPMLHLVLFAGLWPLARKIGEGRRLAVAAVAAALLAPGPAYAVYKLHERGPLPVTAAERDAYLRRALPGYPQLARLETAVGSDYTLCGANASMLHYFARGRFLGNHLGPASTSRLRAAARGGTLFETLRELDACYFLFQRPRGAVFERAVRGRFRLLDRDARFALYALDAPACRRAPGEGVMLPAP